MTTTKNTVLIGLSLGNCYLVVGRWGAKNLVGYWGVYWGYNEQIFGLWGDSTAIPPVGKNPAWWKQTLDLSECGVCQSLSA